MSDESEEKVINSDDNKSIRKVLYFRRNNRDNCFFPA